HLADIGGQSFGNYYPYARDVWQEGVVTTPVRLARNGQVDNDVMELLKLKSRAPVLLAHDVALMYDVGVDVLGKIQREAIKADGVAQLDVARERARVLAARIAEDTVGEGTIHNCAGSDARVTVRLARGGPGIVVDLTESSPQAERGFINSTRATTRS